MQSSSELIRIAATINDNPTKASEKFKLAIRTINKNVNVYVYGLISRVQQTSHFTPLVLQLSLVWSHLLWGQFRAFSAAVAIHNSPLFVPPGTHHCWVNRGGMIRKDCPIHLHMAGSVTRAAVTHPSTNRAQRCLLVIAVMTRTGYHTAMCYHIVGAVVQWLDCSSVTQEPSVQFPYYWKESDVFKLMWRRPGGHGIKYTSGRPIAVIR